MRKIIYFLVAIAFLTHGCSKETNNLPTCGITKPVSGDEIAKGEIVTISVYADDTDGEIVEVEYYVDNLLIGTTDSLPYDMEWNSTDSEKKEVAIKVIVKDNSGASTTDEIVVSVDRLTGTVSDYDGNVYKTVKIGNQWWMAENLRTTHYSDGTEINLIEDETTWQEDGYNIDAYCFYENSNENADIYGALYNWQAVANTSKNICPDGWHVPNKVEWNELDEYLGSVGYSGSQGGALKAKSLWKKDNESDDGNGTDNFGFKAFPAGLRSSNFVAMGYVADFWSSTEYSEMNGYWFHISTYSKNSSLSHMNKKMGFSVRCVKD